MKTHTKLLILSTTLIAITTLIGCNNPLDTTSTTQTGSTIKTETKDSEVTKNVTTTLLLDEKTKGLNITVATLKGDVRLTGVVDNQSQIDYVKNLVRNIEGTHSIHDELSIKK
jgi:hyperosmotically inducible periplasmic protein